MARSSRAFARHPKPFSRVISSHAIDAHDAFHDLRDLHRAYACLQHMLAAAGNCNMDEFEIAPGEIGALLTTINSDFKQRACKVDQALDALVEACRQANRSASRALPPA